VAVVFVVVCFACLLGGSTESLDDCLSFLLVVSESTADNGRFLTMTLLSSCRCLSVGAFLALLLKEKDDDELNSLFDFDSVVASDTPPFSLVSYPVIGVGPNDSAATACAL
jgi:hypothetical protein